MIDTDVAEVLKRASANPTTIKLPAEQLDRKLYTRVNKVLEALGGKWNRSQQVHVFPQWIDAHQELVYALGDGYVLVSDDSFFPTPPELVNYLIGHARLDHEHRVLEPSAGEGALADAINDHVWSPQIVLVEINEQRCKVLRDKGYLNVISADFLQIGFNHDGFDRVVMNPPFERAREVDHVNHAYGLLRPDGRLVSIMSNGITFRDDSKYRDLRELVETYGSIHPNPPGSFKPAGTAVNTVIVIIDKPTED